MQGPYDEIKLVLCTSQGLELYPQQNIIGPAAGKFKDRIVCWLSQDDLIIFVINLQYKV